MNLLPLPISKGVILNGNRKIKLVKKLHKSIYEGIEEKNKEYASKTIKGR